MTLTFKTITVSNGFNPDATFEIDLCSFYFQTPEKVRSDHINEVITAWSKITGLEFTKTPRKDHSHLAGNENVEVIEVESPLMNRSNTIFMWSRK
jgi:hypothetical protein